MRIVYLHQYFTTPDRGGATRSYEFARRWVDAGHEVHVLRIGEVPEGTRGRWHATQIDGIFEHTLAVSYANQLGVWRRLGVFAAYAISAIRRARSLRPDVIYATSTPLTVAIPALTLRAIGRVPYVFEVRDMWPDVPLALGYLKNPIMRETAVALERLAYRHASHIVALAPGMREDIVGKGVPPMKVSVIPQGCDVYVLGRGRPERIRAENTWLGAGPLFTYAGAIGPANGLEYLIDLATAMEALSPAARFVVIGEGKERTELEALARSRGILNRTVFFMGVMNKHEVADWMATSVATLALFSGPRTLWKDAVQNKFFDSLAAGKPIATNNDGWQTHVAVEEGVGRMLDPDDPARAARQLLDMVADSDFMARVPDNCRRLAVGRFNRDRQAAEALALVVAAARGAVDEESPGSQTRSGAR